MLSPDDIRTIALAYAGVRETGEPGRPAFAVRGQVFATLWTPRTLFLEGAGQVDLEQADAALVRPLIEEAWARVAPRAVRREHLQP